MSLNQFVKGEWASGWLGLHETWIAKYSRNMAHDLGEPPNPAAKIQARQAGKDCLPWQGWMNSQHWVTAVQSGSACVYITRPAWPSLIHYAHDRHNNKHNHNNHSNSNGNRHCHFSQLKIAMVSVQAEQGNLHLIFQTTCGNLIRLASCEEDKKQVPSRSPMLQLHTYNVAVKTKLWGVMELFPF